jgi:hypothetical protein
MSTQKTFVTDKIRTSEICGLDGGAVTICGVLADSNSIESLSGHFITGDNLTISGLNDSLIYTKSGIFDVIKANEIIVDGTGSFDELIIDGIKYTPRDHIAYAFYFGGPPVKVPNRFAHITGQGIPDENNPQLFTGLAMGQNYIFLDSTESFKSGDHGIINPGGVYNDGKTQEKFTVSGIDYYRPSNCCNAKAAGSYVAGVDTVSHLDEDNDGYRFYGGDVIKIEGSNTAYTVTGTDVSTSTTRYVEVSPPLTDAVPLSGCLCLVHPTLKTNEVLKNNYPPWTRVANRHSDLVEGNPGTAIPGCSGKCYDNKYLYLEQGVYTGNFDWYLTGYREYFVDFSGIDVHATGDNTSGILTLIYPDLM